MTVVVTVSGESPDGSHTPEVTVSFPVPRQPGAVIMTVAGHTLDANELKVLGINPFKAMLYGLTQYEYLIAANWITHGQHIDALQETDNPATHQEQE